MVCLGLGSSTHSNLALGSGLSDLNMEDKLHQYMVGGRKHDNLNGSAGGNPIANESPNKCSCIYEGSQVNTTVTAPGATLALGLIYLKSNNVAVASRLSVPDTSFLLDFVRPDLLMCRVVAKSLVLWDSVAASEAWLQAQIPQVVNIAWRRLARKAKRPVGQEGQNMHGISSVSDTLNNSNGNSNDQDWEVRNNIDKQLIKQAYCNIVAGACFALGLRFAGTADAAACALVTKYTQQFQQLRDADPKHPQRPDRPTLEMCLGASALALSLITAGTGDLAVLRLFRELRWKVDTDLTYGNHMALGMAIGLLFISGGRATICRSNEAIAALLIALYPFFPTNTTDNRYHMQALRHMYVLALDPRCLEVVDVDTNQAVPAPLVLEMKKAAASGNSINSAQKSEGSVLSVSAPCMLPEIHSIAKITLESPRYFPVTLDLEKFPEHLETLRTFKCIFVKRKKGLMSYAQDPSPSGFRSVLFRSVQHTHRSFCSGIIQKCLEAGDLGEYVETGATELAATSDSKLQSGNQLEQLVKNFTNDEQIIALCRLFCKPDEGAPAVNHASTYSDMSLADFCSTVVSECLSGGKSEILPVYLSMYNGCQSFSVSNSTEFVWNIKMLCTYYDCLPWKVPEVIEDSARPAATAQHTAIVSILQDPLLKLEYLHAVRNKVEGDFENLGFQNPRSQPASSSCQKDGLSEFGQYLVGSGPTNFGKLCSATAGTDISSVDGFVDSQRAFCFGSFLSYFDIPHPSALYAQMGAYFLSHLSTPAVSTRTHNLESLTLHKYHL